MSPVPKEPKVTYSGVNKTAIKVAVKALAWSTSGGIPKSSTTLNYYTLPVGCFNISFYETGGKQSSLKIECPNGNLSAPLTSFTYYNSSGACLGNDKIDINFGTSSGAIPSVLDDISSSSDPFRCYSGKTIALFRFDDATCSSELLTHLSATTFLPVDVCDASRNMYKINPNGTYELRAYDDAACATTYTVSEILPLGTCRDAYSGSDAKAAW